MPVFKYVGLQRDGTNVDGEIDLPTENDVRNHLRQQGIRLKKLSKASIFNADLSFGSPVKEVELSIMTQQLAIMLEAGLPILQALQILESGEQNPALKKILKKVSASISGGGALWEALSVHKKVFPNIYIYLVRAGEFSGSLGTSLKRLATYLENSVALKRMVKGAMIYPAVIAMVGMGVTFGLLAFVVPQFESMIKSGGGELPAITAFVIAASDFASSQAHIIIGGVIAVIFIFKKIISTPNGRMAWHLFLLSVPGIKTLITKSSTAVFTRTLGTMLLSGVNLVDAIEICKDVIDNEVMKRSLTKVKAEIVAGKSIAGPLARTKLFPHMVVQMVSVGENTGALDKMLIRIADFYEEEVKAVVSALTKLIEPLVLVVLGGVVATILIAMYLPIFQLAGGA